MKKALFVLGLLFYILNVNAQTTVISDVSHTGDASAVLDVYSTSKGMLIPRLTESAKNSITDPATGLIVYQTDGTVGYYYNSGTPASPTWTRIGSFTLPGLTAGSVLFSDGSTVNEDNANLFWNDAANRLGIGTSTPSTSLSFGGDAARTIALERNSSTSGSALYLQAGGALSGGTNLTGGSLYLKSGISTGTGTSAIYFQTPSAGSTGTGDNSLTTKMIIWGNGSISMGTTTWLTNTTLFVSGSGNTNQQSLYSYATGGSTENRAIWGKTQSEANSANNYGVIGEVLKPESGSTSGASVGVWGISDGSNTVNHGIHGQAKGNGTENIGVYGISEGATGTNYGMWGAAYVSGATQNIGVRGYSYTGTSGYGIEGIAENATSNYAIRASASGGTTNYSFYGSSGRFYNAGSIEFPITSETGNYTATASDYTIIGNPSSGTITISLPTASAIDGRIYIIKNITSNIVEVDPYSSETIDGNSTNYSLGSMNKYIMIQSDGSGWLIISNN